MKTVNKGKNYSKKALAAFSYFGFKRIGVEGNTFAHHNLIPPFMGWLKQNKKDLNKYSFRSELELLLRDCR